MLAKALGSAVFGIDAYVVEVDAGLIGGGQIPKPGEVSLSHNKVLFPDELPVFRKERSRGDAPTFGRRSDWAGVRCQGLCPRDSTSQKVLKTLKEK